MAEDYDYVAQYFDDVYWRFRTAQLTIVDQAIISYMQDRVEIREYPDRTEFWFNDDLIREWWMK